MYSINKIQSKWALTFYHKGHMVPFRRPSKILMSKYATAEYFSSTIAYFVINGSIIHS